MDTTQDAKVDSNRSRVILSRAVAREIFVVKSNLGLESAHQASIRLAAKYRISSKAIRDIWNGRSWLDATFDLWNEEDRPPRRVIGRPKGKKDSKPRVRVPASGGQGAHGNVLQHAGPPMVPCDYFDECKFQYAHQFNASRASDSCRPSQSFNFGEQIPGLMDSRADQTTSFLPRFGILTQGMGIVPTLHEQIVHHAASHSDSLRFPKD